MSEHPLRRFISMRRARSLLLVLAVVLLTSVVAGSQSDVARATAPGGWTFVLDDYQGFDTCITPSTDATSAWWSSTQYYYIGIYMGGADFAPSCDNSALTASWVSTVASQGWSFIPLWVGPQAPCWTSGGPFQTYISENTASAHAQGVSSADAAMNAALNLGFAKGTVVYDDIEGYNTGDSACVAGVDAFVNGWDAEIKGSTWASSAGIYGSAGGAKWTDFAGQASAPSDAFVANWNMTANVWNLGSLIPNSYWVGDRRIHQYIGGHDEVNGGSTLNIDTDCALGQVAGGDLDLGNETDAPGTNESNGPTEDPSC